MLGRYEEEDNLLELRQSLRVEQKIIELVVKGLFLSSLLNLWRSIFMHIEESYGACQEAQSNWDVFFVSFTNRQRQWNVTIVYASRSMDSSRLKWIKIYIILLWSM